MFVLRKETPLSLLKKFINSRKFWATVVGFVTVLSTALEDGTLSQGEVNALAGIIIGYVFSVAFEDGMTNRVNWNSTTTTTTSETPTGEVQRTETDVVKE